MAPSQLPKMLISKPKSQPNRSSFTERFTAMLLALSELKSKAVPKWLATSRQARSPSSPARFLLVNPKSATLPPLPRRALQFLRVGIRKIEITSRTSLRIISLRITKPEIKRPSVITSLIPWPLVFSKTRATGPARSLVLFVSTASRNPSWQFPHIVRGAMLI